MACPDDRRPIYTRVYPGGRRPIDLRPIQRLGRPLRVYPRGLYAHPGVWRSVKDLSRGQWPPQGLSRVHRGPFWAYPGELETHLASIKGKEAHLVTIQRVGGPFRAYPEGSKDHIKNDHILRGREAIQDLSGDLSGYLGPVQDSPILDVFGPLREIYELLSLTRQY